MHWTHWAESAEQNKKVIGEAIAPYLSTAKQVLEIGSGTGQHAVHFAAQHPQLSWQPTEHPANLPALAENLQHFGLSNTQTPIALDASATQWPALDTDLVYSANTLHIMSWDSACQLFKNLGNLLSADQQVLFYGPFRFQDRAFAESNVNFDRWLKQQNPLSGIRDMEKLIELGSQSQLSLEQVIDMPANNHILVWKRNV